MRKKLVCSFLIIRRDKHNDFVLLHELFEFSFWFKFTTRRRQHIVKLSLFDELANDIESTLEDAFDVDLRESWPFGVEL